MVCLLLTNDGHLETGTTMLSLQVKKLDTTPLNKIENLTFDSHCSSQLDFEFLSDLVQSLLLFFQRSELLADIFRSIL